MGRHTLKNGDAVTDENETVEPQTAPQAPIGPAEPTVEQALPVTAPQSTEPDIYLDEDVVWRFRK